MSVPPPTPGLGYAQCLMLFWARHPEAVFTTSELAEMWGVESALFMQSLKWHCTNGLVAMESQNGKRGTRRWKAGPALLRRIGS